MKKKGQTWENFLFVSGFDAEKQKEEVKENKCETSGKQTEQDLEPTNETSKELAEKLIVVNDELSEVCVTKNVNKELCSYEIVKEKSVENLRAKGVDLSSKPRTRLRSKLEAEISPNPVLDPLEDSELVVIAESIS